MEIEGAFMTTLPSRHSSNNLIIQREILKDQNSNQCVESGHILFLVRIRMDAVLMACYVLPILETLLVSACFAAPVLFVHTPSQL